MLRRARLGFTLIELWVALSIVGILSGVALPAYIDYVQRSRVSVTLDALSSYATRMEQRYQDAGSYASDGNCAASLPTTANIALSCSITSSGQGFSAVASGSGSMAGYSYSIDQVGNRVTLSHPKGVKQSSQATFARDCPEAGQARPPPKGVKQSGQATFARDCP